ncbi:MAG: outer membrane beta-barrel protein [Bacteroidota bacterium]
MKSHLLLLSLLLSFYSFSQNTTNGSKEKGSSRFEIGVNFSPDLCYRTLDIIDASATGASLVYNDRNKNEVFKPGFSTGFSACYYLKKRLGIEAGVQFSDKGYNRKWYDLSFGSHLDPLFGFNGDTTNMAAKMKLNYHNYYFDIPFSVKYVLGKKNLRFETRLGVAVNIFIKETITTVLEYNNGEHERSSSETNYKYEPLNISPFAGFGIIYQINKSMSLSMAPIIRYGVFKIIKNEPLTAYLWNAGLDIGFRYRF